MFNNLKRPLEASAVAFALGYAAWQAGQATADSICCTYSSQCPGNSVCIAGQESCFYPWENVGYCVS
jgi:hypothetical protein